MCRCGRQGVLSGGMAGFLWFPASGAEWRMTAGVEAELSQGPTLKGRCLGTVAYINIYAGLSRTPPPVIIPVIISPF